MESRPNPISMHSRKPAGGTHFFFALKPDEKARVEIANISERFRKTHRLIGSAVDSDDFHLTLVDMGRPERLQQSLEDALVAAAEEVCIKGFEIVLDSAMRLSATKDGNFPFVLCADNTSTGLAMKLRRAIADAQHRHGLQVLGVSNYLPHVTVLRGGTIDAVQESMAPIRWNVHEFVLIRSFFGQSRHEVMGRWPLIGEAEPESLDWLAELDALGKIDLPIDE
ncbi:MAG TPA: 2'-5' RNA ligase family protein [Rhodanobacter sp.]